MVPEPEFASKSKNPGVGKSSPPTSPAWWLGAGSIPTWGLEIVTFVTLTADCTAGRQAPGSRTPSHQLAENSAPSTVGPSTPAGWGNFQIGKPKKAISPNLNVGGNTAQIWNLPNLDGADRLPCKTLNAVIAEVEFGCMKVSEEAPKQCKTKINNPLLAKPLQSQSQKGISDNTKCLGFPVQCFALFMPHKDDSI
ncbi:hypothetical protein DSO57_1033057 [Entomophthora muscae]|uniref:Uncharacterized protein n=1 Tax=Entomophthora muscae TaxID=34485 RepID=A0ACC2SPK0_9FUNG|nr:hypothetical protein DSO57_1033057 [Entomophthora muscae]